MSAGQIATARIAMWQPLVLSALVAVFATGLISGLILVRAADQLGQGSVAVAAPVTAAGAAAAYTTFRQGERAALGSQPVTVDQSFRQGERAALGAASGADANQLFRQDERSGLGAAAGTDAYQLFRQGERAP